MQLKVTGNEVRTSVRYHDIVGRAMSETSQRNALATRVPISFTQESHEWLREEAFRQRVSMAELVRLALDEYREREEAKVDRAAIRGSA